MKQDLSVRRKIRKVTNTAESTVDDLLAVEEPLEIALEYGRIGYREQRVVSVTMRTPGNDEELAIGFLFTEGIIRSPAEVIKTIVQAAENKVLVQLAENVQPTLQNTQRNFYMSSSCGVCGKASIEAINTVTVFHREPDVLKVDKQVLFGLSAELMKYQAVFNLTGGLHASALFRHDGKLLIVKEDVGRHNALDKVIGTCFLENNLPLSSSILFLSGRASFELIQKAVMAGILVVAAIGAPSSLAVEMAEKSGITLVGFLRSGSFNIYAGVQRVGSGGAEWEAHKSVTG